MSARHHIGAGPALSVEDGGPTVCQHRVRAWDDAGILTSSVARTKHLYNICTTSAQRLRCWSNIVQILYKCFVLTSSARPWAQQVMTGIEGVLTSSQRARPGPGEGALGWRQATQTGHSMLMRALSDPVVTWPGCWPWPRSPAGWKSPLTASEHLDLSFYCAVLGQVKAVCLLQ